jgi:hypothetical protein
VGHVCLGPGQAAERAAEVIESWAMMILSLAGLGFLACRNKRTLRFA